MRTQTKKIEPDKIYVCWQGVAADVNGTPRVAKRGDRLRGSDPLVKQMGRDAFVEDGTPETEWPTIFDASVEAQEAKAVPPTVVAPRIDPSTPIGELSVCVRTILHSRWGACEVHKVLRSSDELVREVPEAFEELTKRLG